MITAQEGHDKCLSLLLANGAEVNKSRDVSEVTTCLFQWCGLYIASYVVDAASMHLGCMYTVTIIVWF